MAIARGDFLLQALKIPRLLFAATPLSKTGATKVKKSHKILKIKGIN
jgi:hypothetical protein